MRVADDDIIHLRSCDRYEGQSFRVVDASDDGAWCDLEPLRHQNMHGDVVQDDDDHAYCVDVEVAKLNTIDPPRAAVCARRTSERGATWIDAKADAVVHAMGDDGPRCGRRLTHDKTREAGRWDPWLKETCPERRTTSLWLPTHRAVTCKPCLKSLAKVDE